MDCKSLCVAARVGGKLSGALITSVGGGAESRCADEDFAAAGSDGADKTDPSIRQKVNMSSKVRLHAGQLFIAYKVAQPAARDLPLANFFGDRCRCDYRLGNFSLRVP